jgi:ubiquinone biosynthesis protein
MIGFLEGCLLHGAFHGDLHGGNLFVRDDGTTALLDFGIVGRMDDGERRAFLKLMIAGTMSDVRGQLSALCELGALPRDTDVDEVIRDLGLDRPPVDPTTLTQDEMIAELQRVLKAMLGYGARLPKSLLLFVKNLIFLDGAIATLAPELDLLGEVAHVATHFATKHGASIAAEVGMDPSAYEVDLDSVKDAFGIDRERDTFTYAELRKRRELIRRRLHGTELSLA